MQHIPLVLAMTSRNYLKMNIRTSGSGGREQLSGLLNSDWSFFVILHS